MENLPEVVESKPLTVSDVKTQVDLIHNIMKEVMKDGEHYGKIPGCGPKPALLKAGAEKLNFTFRLAPDIQTEFVDLGEGQREYRVKCVMNSILTGRTLGSGVGSASTLEKKWHRDNPADMYNTVWKMAKKRALVDAVLTVTAASDIFTQDIEESGEQKAEEKAAQTEGKSEYTSSHSPPSNTANKISLAQSKRFYAIAKSTRASDDAIKDWLAREYNLHSTKDIPVDLYDEICTRVKDDLTDKGE